MATRKRTSPKSSRSDLVGRAVRAGRKALHDAESRVPTDVRRQLERSVKDGQKALKTAIDQLQAQIRRTAKQADVDKALKRLDGLSKQVQQIARGVASGRATRSTPTKRRASTTTKRASSTATKRKPATRKSSTRASASPSSAAPAKAATRRRSPRRKTTPAPPRSESADEGGPSA